MPVEPNGRVEVVEPVPSTASVSLDTSFLLSKAANKCSTAWAHEFGQAVPRFESCLRTRSVRLVYLKLSLS